MAGLVMASLSDLVAQVWVEHKSVEAKRNLIYSAYSFIEVGIEFVWLKSLDRYCGPCMGLYNALRKTVIDQLTFSAVEPAAGMIVVHIAEAQPEPLSNKLKRDYPVFLLSYQVFSLPVSLVCFAYVPLQWRVMYTCALSCIWDVFSSFSFHNNLKASVSSSIDSVKTRCT
jgi:hypothetical protein